jgi:hypothetical protein
MENKENDFQKELNKLKKVKPDERRQVFLGYCQKNIKLKNTNALSIGEASNRICGACSLYFKDVMPEFEEVMNIACDLELPKEYCERDPKNWDKLEDIMKNKS